MDMNELLTINLPRLQAMIDVSSKIGALADGGLCRLALSNEDKAMRDIFVNWLQDAGLTVRVDDFGNIYGRRKGKKPGAAPVMIGSHLDTQPAGGKFDGILGVLAGLEVVHVLNDHHIETEHPIEIVSFTNEEGARFQPPMLGSGGIAGVFEKDFILGRKDKEGRRFDEELKRVGYFGSAEDRPKDIHRYLELHIEQGPVLEKENFPVAAVEGISGMTWIEVTVTGESNHAGPTPMVMRRDALVVTAKMISVINQLVRVLDEDLTATTGQIKISPNVINCIPSTAVFSVDVRHPQDSVRGKAISMIQEKIATIAASGGVTVSTNVIWDIAATQFSQEIISYVYAGSTAHGYPVRSMISGAGHDAKYMNDIVPSAMIFVPSVKGRSHCQEEFTRWEDIEKGVNVLLYTVQALAQKTEERVDYHADGS